MTNDTFLILPCVKSIIRVLAHITILGLMLSAVLGVAEILLLSFGILRIGIICGIIGSLLLPIETAILSVLALWSHRVLLFQRGYFLTACLAGGIIILSHAWPACRVYSLLTGKLLLTNQGLFPLLICPALVFILLFNLPNMAAASQWLKIRLGIFPFMLLFIYICDQPGLILMACIGKLLLWGLLVGPLRQLANIAPCIISLPPTKENSNEEQS